ncbi:LpxL/LpxP family acyltransferase [Caenimonas soli]|uniref:LpxL/LpxP family acyltransferase n=1 Tax=Caenimonas soli TaxID=2735555 RepID=UPI001552101B|nr:lipid A biosynthesis acyltransferase [Caenimonas soli]NPC57959.1 lipid A biosynthesis acyltransferase [Caenimonas soli]
MKLWTDKAERGSAWLIQLIVWLARSAGRPLCRALLYPIVLYFVLTDRTARRASAEFLQAVHGRPARWREVFAHFHSFAGTLLDRVYMAAGEFDRFEVTIEGLPLVDRLLQTGKGCLLLGSHLGSFDLMMLTQRAMDGRPISIMMRVDPRSKVRRIAGIDDGGPSFIPLGRPESYLRAHEALTRGEIIALLADRADGAAACLPARFLEKTVAMPIAPHVLAARSSAPVLMCFGLYEGGNRYRIEFVEFGSAAPAASRGAALQPVVDRYAGLLEQYARRYPLNWFNFYPYWASAEGGA